MNIELTLFKSVFDNKTHRNLKFNSFDSFTDFLIKCSKVRGCKPKKGERATSKHSPLISPAIYSLNQTRKNTNVLYWAGWAALDIDDYEGTMHDAVSKFSDYNYVCYSTASSKTGHERFRIVLELNDWVQASKIKKFWYALNKEFNDLGDPQTKDLSRMYYVPAIYESADNFISINKGKPIDISELIDKHPYHEKKSTSIIDELPDEMRKDLLNRIAERLTNRNIKWTSYKDCPFVSKQMISEYMSINSTGWYQKLYSLMMSIASRAVLMEYPISVSEIVSLVREIDADTGSWYTKRPIDLEASRALTFVLQKSLGMKF